jgi:hypothetical protein
MSDYVDSIGFFRFYGGGDYGDVGFPDSGDSC